jgi:hypothetical protein
MMMIKMDAREGVWRWEEDLVLGFCEHDTEFMLWPSLWSSGQSSWLQIQRSRVRFPALPDFLRNGGSGTGSTQPR